MSFTMQGVSFWRRFAFSSYAAGVSGCKDSGICADLALCVGGFCGRRSAASDCAARASGYYVSVLLIFKAVWAQFGEAMLGFAPKMLSREEFYSCA